MLRVFLLIFEKKIPLKIRFEINLMPKIEKIYEYSKPYILIITHINTLKENSRFFIKTIKNNSLHASILIKKISII
ncbi:hypothetical protein BpHYR1_011212 [Brachionus plicatilis]|uniref:Uncharacterized protein n=1 Tax=Brachionus plicatilis TaxID=10195 RepID=A0A3M7SNG6_BRAPC|nr:hypothetical protein BpHYR1_011212 [Brachionus plicatilis]